MLRNLATVLVLLLGTAALPADARLDKVDPSPRRGDRHQAVITGPAGEEIFEIYGFSHEVVSPRDAASGLPTGKRQHKPFSVTKPVDKASASLLGSLLSAARIESVTMTSFHRKRGRWIAYREIRLDEVYVRSVGQKPCPEDGADDRPVEEVAFYYNKITWSYEGGVEHTDNWRENN